MIELGNVLDRAADTAKGVAETASEGARTLYVQNLPGHGWLWEYIPPNEPGGAREYRITPTGKKWATGAALLAVGLVLMGGKK